MTATVVAFRWLDLLEKEFDKSFVDLDMVIGEVEDVDEGEWSHQVRTKLGGLSSCFAQLAHKAQTIFQTNAKLEAELLNLRHELAQNEALYNVIKEENHELLVRIHSFQLQLHKQQSHDQEIGGDSSDIEFIKERLEKQLEEERNVRLSMEVPRQEVILLKQENEMLRKHMISLQGELSGAKLTAKYLDKELAGRIQQLQLLSRELRGENHEKLWKQLEAEIHLHRHKTVVRACRTNTVHAQCEARPYMNGSTMPKPPANQNHRIVTIHKAPDQGLGMSITGGREHGVPILISVLQSDLPAGSCGELYVGDAILSVNGISLKETSHMEAVDILSSQEGEMKLEVVFVSPEDEEEDGSLADDSFAFMYKVFDDEVESLTSSVQAQNGRLSRASVDSIRGSTENILGSPRRSLDPTLEAADESESGIEDQYLNESSNRNLDSESTNLISENYDYGDTCTTTEDEEDPALPVMTKNNTKHPTESQESTESSLSMPSSDGTSKPNNGAMDTSSGGITLDEDVNCSEDIRKHIVLTHKKIIRGKEVQPFSDNLFNSNY